MHNPYAASQAGAGASPTTEYSSAQSTRASDYDNAIGPHGDYYRPRFEKYDSDGAGVSWNWPAFLLTSSWYVYRKLYLLGILNFFYPWILLFVGGFLIGIRAIPAQAGGALIILLGPVPWLLLTLFANRIYWRRVNRIIADTPAYPDAGRRMRELQSAGGVARGPMVAMVVVTALFLLGYLRALTVTALPAYQDYKVRAEVSEGLKLAGDVKARVAEYWAEHRQWPRQSDLSAGGDGTSLASGKFTHSVAVDAGSIVITYGNRAAREIAGKRLVLHPGVDESGKIVWTCGNAAMPDGLTPGDGPHGSEVPDKYLPTSCRPG